MEKLIGNFMLVEAVLRYMNSNKLVPLPQYTVEGFPNHFFNCEDVKAKIGEKEFRLMECTVVTHMFVSKSETV